MANSPFLNEVRTSIRVRVMSIRTDKTYIYWIRFFIRYNNCRHPREIGSWSSTFSGLSSHWAQCGS